MQRPGRRLVLFLFALLALAALAALIAFPLLAQTGGGYDLTWNSIDGGGGVSSGGGYLLSGTIGQADAGLSSGAVYTLSGGFWTVAGVSNTEVSYSIFLPSILR